MINGEISTYHGQKAVTFDFEGHQAKAVIPETPAEGKPYLWRAEFFGAFDAVDAMLLSHGWHIVYLNIKDRFGCPSAIEDMKQFHDFIVPELGLRNEAVICGMSRGGLYSVNYAARYPEDVAGLYLDAPVLNLLSWPFGLGEGCGSEYDSELCLDVYGIDKGSVINLRDNPIDKTDVLLSNEIPICFICGGADNVVPYHENAECMISLYEKNGGEYRLFFKPECGHHPHSLDDPTEAVMYIETHM